FATTAAPTPLALSTTFVAPRPRFAAACPARLAFCARLSAVPPLPALSRRVPVGLGMRTGFTAGRCRLRLARRRDRITQLRKEFLQHDNRGWKASAFRRGLQ